MVDSGYLTRTAGISRDWGGLVEIWPNLLASGVICRDLLGSGRMCRYLWRALGIGKDLSGITLRDHPETDSGAYHLPHPTAIHPGQSSLLPPVRTDSPLANTDPLCQTLPDASGIALSSVMPLLLCGVRRSGDYVAVETACLPEYCG